MYCGDGVPLCGVLALESGLGKGHYHGDTMVHGLWPQVGNYGSSKCIPPQTSTVERHYYQCYSSAGSNSDQLWFESHEWSEHGICAGAIDEDDFFQQVCDLSREPLNVMRSARNYGFDAMID